MIVSSRQERRGARAGDEVPATLDPGGVDHPRSEGADDVGLRRVGDEEHLCAGRHAETVMSHGPDRRLQVRPVHDRAPGGQVVVVDRERGAAVGGRNVPRQTGIRAGDRVALLVGPARRVEHGTSHAPTSSGVKTGSDAKASVSAKPSSKTNARQKWEAPSR